MRATIRQSVLEDASYLGPRLREEDKQEIAANSGRDPVTGLLHAWLFSNPCCNTIIGCDGSPIGMFGYTDNKDDISATVWMLSTEDVRYYRRQFIRESRVWLEELNQKFPVLMNIIDARNKTHIRWLSSMGFTFINKKIFGPENRLFYDFVRVNTKDV